MKQKEFFSSRLGFVLSMIGIAIGAGNIWRFPRIVAQNGGLVFLVLWFMFLITWSIPLIIIELGIGKLTKKAPIGAVIKTAGKNFAWAGAFIALVTTAILAYYSSVVGWGASYFIYSIKGILFSHSNLELLWNDHCCSMQPLFFHFLSILFATFITYNGIKKGIERCNKILIPLFIFCLVIIFIRAITLPNAWLGIKSLFSLNVTDFKNYKIWIEALTQNAWDTGAGWGLLLVYAGYVRKKEAIVSNGIITAVSNNIVSLIMGIIVFSAVFSLDNQGILALISGSGSSNLGLTFIYLPKLFSQLPGSILIKIFFSSAFFLAFAVAALSSLISMFLLTAQTIEELNISKKISFIITAIISFLLGIPSALKPSFFNNQDTVWGIGLIINGLIIALSVIKYGLIKFKKKVINNVSNDIHLNKNFDFLIKIVIPIEGISLVCWYFYQSFISNPKSWFYPFSLTSLANLILQWSIPLIIFISFNKWLIKRNHSK